MKCTNVRSRERGSTETSWPGKNYARITVEFPPEFSTISEYALNGIVYINARYDATACAGSPRTFPKREFLLR